MTEANSGINQALYQQLNNVVPEDKLQEVSQILGNAALAHGVFMNFKGYKTAADKIKQNFEEAKTALIPSGEGSGFQLPAELKGFMTPENFKKAMSIAKDPKAALKKLADEAKQQAAQKLDEATGGSGIVKDLVNDPQATAKKFVAQGQDMLNQGKAQVNDVINQGKAQVNDVINQGKDMLAQGREQLNAVANQGKDMLAQGKEQLNAAVSQGKDMLEQGKAAATSAINDATAQGKQAIKQGQAALEGAAAQGQAVLKQGKATVKGALDGAVAEGKATLSSAESSLKEQGKEILAQGKTAMKSAKAAGKQAAKEATAWPTDIFNESRGALSSSVEEQRNTLRQLTGGLYGGDANVDTSMLEQNLQSRLNMPISAAFEDPATASDLMSGKSRIQQMLSAGAEDTGGLRGDATLARVLGGSGLDGIKIKGYAPKLRGVKASVAKETTLTGEDAAGAANDALTAIGLGDAIKSGSKSAIAMSGSQSGFTAIGKTGEALGGELGEAASTFADIGNDALGVAGLGMAIKSKNKTAIGAQSGQMAASEAAKSVDSLGANQQEQAQIQRTAAVEQEMTTIKAPTPETTPGIQETSFPSNPVTGQPAGQAVTGEQAANQSEKAANAGADTEEAVSSALDSTQEALDPELTETGPIGWAIEGGLLLATIGTQIADLFKSKSHQPITESGYTVGV